MTRTASILGAAVHTLLVPLAILVAIGLLFRPAPAVAGTPAPFPTLTSFETAKAEAAERNVPILLRMGKGWCTDCYGFDKAVEHDAELQKALKTKVVFYVVDVTQGEGVELARTYSVSDKVLHFILANSKGELMDRWTNYFTGETFTEHLTAALENPITVAERLERFGKQPTEIDARKLGELRDFEGYSAEAVAYYRRAQSLNPKSDVNYNALVLNAMVRGFSGQLFRLDEVKGQAEIVQASSKDSPKELIDLAYVMGKAAKIADDRSVFLPYLRVAIERSEGTTDETVQKMRGNLLPDYALYIKKDVKQAVEFKKATFDQMAQPKDWREDANMLNNFAWWCFENQVNLDEADKLARRGVELATAGQQKANILDTVAEICNVKGDCGDAVEYARLAVAQAPENEYFQKQVGRFEKLLAEQNR